MPSMKPEAAHSAPTIAQVSMVTLRLSTPDRRARSGLSDIARIALPQREWRRKSVNPITISTTAASVYSSRSRSRMPK